MSKYKITSPIYFDGVCFPADTIVDVSAIPISGECLVDRSWGVPYDGDEPAITSVEQLRAPEVSPQVSPEVSPQVDEPVATTAEVVDVPPPVYVEPVATTAEVEDEPPPPRRRRK